MILNERDQQEKHSPYRGKCTGEAHTPYTEKISPKTASQQACWGLDIRQPVPHRSIPYYNKSPPRILQEGRLVTYHVKRFYIFLLAAKLREWSIPKIQYQVLLSWRMEPCSRFVFLEQQFLLARRQLPTPSKSCRCSTAYTGKTTLPLKSERGNH